MDKIILHQMEFYGYHGVLPEEAVLGQKYIIDITVELFLQKAGQTDQLSDTINYSELYQIAQQVTQGERYQLIETIAEKIAGQVLQQFLGVSSVEVKVHKPTPPMPGIHGGASVIIVRNRLDVKE